MTVQVTVAAVFGQQAERSEDDLIAVLKSNASRKEKDAACRELVLVGTAKSVPTLAAMLGDAELSHMARYALEPIPGPEVEAALRDALGKLKGRRLVGVIGSIGVRRDKAATEALAKLLGSDDAEVAAAAARSLGRIGSAAAADALASARSAASPERRPAIVEGLFRCAEALAAGGEQQKASAIYDCLRGYKAAPHQVRTAALRGAVLTRGEAGLPLLLEALRSDDFRVVGAAARTALELSGRKATVALAEELGKLPPDTQVLLAQALARRGDAEALPGLIGLAQKGEKAARIAAVRALAELGDGRALSVLVKLQGDADNDVAGIAGNALAALEGPEVDAAFAEMLKAENADIRLAAIRLLGRRRSSGGALPALVAAARKGDEKVRAASLGVLAQSAGPEEFPMLLDILTRADSARVLKSAAAALSATCGRMAQSDPGRVKIVKALYGDLPDGKARDVTRTVAAMVAKGKLSVAASNGPLGGDPAQGTRKKLRVDYSVDGATFSETVDESGVIAIRAGAMPDEVVNKLCAAFDKAGGAAKVALLRVLESAGGGKALAVVRSAMASGDADVKREAETVFCDWPGVEVLPALLAMARKSTSTRSKVLALRGCCRLIPRHNAPADEKLALVKDVLELCERDDERRLALSALADLRVPGALSVAMAHVDKPGLKEEACLAAVSVAEKLGRKDRSAVAEAMAKVCKTTANRQTKRRARVALDKAGGRE